MVMINLPRQDAYVRLFLKVEIELFKEIKNYFNGKCVECMVSK